MMKKILFTMMAAGVMASGAVAQDSGAKTTEEKGAEGAKDIAKLLKDQLIEVDGEKVKPAKLDEGMEYYLVYHSASW